QHHEVIGRRRIGEGGAEQAGQGDDRHRSTEGLDDFPALGASDLVWGRPQEPGDVYGGNRQNLSADSDEEGADDGQGRRTFEGEDGARPFRPAHLHASVDALDRTPYDVETEPSAGHRGGLVTRGET